MEDRRTRTVVVGYDRIAGQYLEWVTRIEGDPRDRMLAELAERLPPGGRVLDLGCGPGVPSTRALAQRFDVVGVDISAAQIALARTNVPEARFIHADLARIDLPDASFDGVTALYSISHVPREHHPQVFARIARWLVPGGLFLATLGATDSPDWVGEWLGGPMFFSGHDADTNRALLRAAGFTVERDETIAMREPEGPVTFLWVIARKLGPPAGGSGARSDPLAPGARQATGETDSATASEGWGGRMWRSMARWMSRFVSRVRGRRAGGRDRLARLERTADSGPNQRSTHETTTGCLLLGHNVEESHLHDH